MKRNIKFMFKVIKTTFIVIFCWMLITEYGLSTLAFSIKKLDNLKQEIIIPLTQDIHQKWISAKNEIANPHSAATECEF